METKKVDPRRLAYQEYQDSKQKARFTSIAQKLAQHINHLAQDKNSRIRWIWELIQNAKDVPNQFGRCRIRIEIKDDKLIFAHNGDPFRVSDLESLVAQYSSKAEENKISTETTGKYGTGFIVTYILSRKVRIKGLLTMKTHQQQQATKDQIEQDQVQLSSEDQISNAKSRIHKNNQIINQAQESLSTDINIQDHVQTLMPQKSKLKNFEGGSLYQRFEILLDRDYKDRDNDLVKKLMLTERNLMADLLKNQPEPKWQRKQGQLNTQFIYQDIDQAANKMINQSMACLKQLFPYALLFNPKLFQIQVIDKRTRKSIKKFGIKRLEEDRFNGIRIFNANILQEGEQQARKFSLAYIDDEDTYSTVAIPLEIRENSIKLLEVNNKLPKMFKQFPLIGCKDIGFNFVFTSKRFYPNQTRSNLLLEQIEGRDNKKPRANWESVISIFQKGLQLYKAVSRIIDDGQQNLFIVSLDNQFVKDFPNKKMLQIFSRYLQEISDLKCIQFSNKSYGSIKQLTFPFGTSENKKIECKNYCSGFNCVFSIVLGEETTLNDQKYKKFYPKFAEYSNTWQDYTAYADVHACIIQFSKLKFEELVYKMKQDRQAALKIVQKIYEFLNQNHPNYLLPVNLQAQQQNKGKKNGQPLKFILTNKEQFKDINSNLAIKKQLPPAYEEVGLKLNINITEFTIHDRLTKYFPKIKPFGVVEILNLFEKYFYSFTTKVQKENIVLLGRFILTFSIKSQAFDIASKLRHLQKVVQPFEIQDKKNLLVLDNRAKRQYQILFQMTLLHHINKLMNNCADLQSLMQLTIYPKSQKQKAIQWLNNVFKLQDSLLKDGKSAEFKKAYNLFYLNSTKLIDKSLSLNEKLVNIQYLRVFCLLKDKNYFKGSYPDNKDIEFYQKMKQVFNRRTKNYPLFKPVVIQGKSAMKDYILHQSINYKLPSATTFKNQFVFITALYNYKNSDYPNSSITREQKIEILNYIYHLRQSTIKNREMEFKIHVFQQLEKNAYHEYAYLKKSIQKTENQIYAHVLMRNQHELQAARLIAEQFGSMRQALEQVKTLKTKKEQTKF